MSANPAVSATVSGSTAASSIVAGPLSFGGGLTPVNATGWLFTNWPNTTAGATQYIAWDLTPSVGQPVQIFLVQLGFDISVSTFSTGREELFLSRGLCIATLTILHPDSGSCAWANKLDSSVVGGREFHYRSNVCSVHSETWAVSQACVDSRFFLFFFFFFFFFWVCLSFSTEC